MKILKLKRTLKYKVNQFFIKSNKFIGIFFDILSVRVKETLILLLDFYRLNSDGKINLFFQYLLNLPP
jgi:CRISPR/Cas system CMR-associated protein Cmr3 (group 5 of RAMP superfamily)